jgi:rhodanese-related sulfurtransferase
MIVASIFLFMAAAALIYFLSRNSFSLTRPPAATPTVLTDVSVDEAFFLFGEDGVVFLDIRPDYEWKAYRIDKSVNIPYADISKRLGELPKTGTIVVMDAIGGEPAIKTFDLLKQAGFTNAIWVRGGIEAWVQRRYPIIGTAPY